MCERGGRGGDGDFESVDIVIVMGERNGRFGIRLLILMVLELTREWGERLEIEFVAEEALNELHERRSILLSIFKQNLRIDAAWSYLVSVYHKSF